MFTWALIVKKCYLPHNFYLFYFNLPYTMITEPKSNKLEAAKKQQRDEIYINK